LHIRLQNALWTLQPQNYMASINGTPYSDYLTGTTGNDLFAGGTGNDTMVGGLGNDTYWVDSLGDVVVEYAGEGTDQIVTTISWDLTANPNVENLWLSGDATHPTTATTGTGNSLNNYITGNYQNNSLYGGAGNDTLSAKEGNDFLDGGTGSDYLQGGDGNDTYVVDDAGDVISETATGGTDTILVSSAGVIKTNYTNVENWQFTGNGGFAFVGTSGADSYVGDVGKDSLSGLGGSDTLDGAAGDDTIDGGTGADSMLGGSGNDLFFVDNAGDAVVELASNGNDTVSSSVSYALASNVENLILTGTGNLSGVGNDLDNVITGNSGNNVLDGSAGADTLIGGAGDDTYYIDNLLDVITEGVAGGTDTVYYLASLWPIIAPVFANVEFYVSLGTIVGTPGPDLLNGDLVIPQYQ